MDWWCKHAASNKLDRFGSTSRYGFQVYTVVNPRSKVSPLHFHCINRIIKIWIMFYLFADLYYLYRPIQGTVRMKPPGLRFVPPLMSSRFLLEYSFLHMILHNRCYWRLKPSEIVGLPMSWTDYQICWLERWVVSKKHPGKVTDPVFPCAILRQLGFANWSTWSSRLG